MMLENVISVGETMDPIKQRETWLPLVYKIAHSAHIRTGHDKDDLIQSGYIGMDRALTKWISKQGDGQVNKTTLQKYLQHGISIAMTQWMREDCLISKKGDKRKLSETSRYHNESIQYLDAPIRADTNSSQSHYDRLEDKSMVPDQAVEYNDYAQHIKEVIIKLATVSAPRLGLSVTDVNNVITEYIRQKKYHTIARETGVSVYNVRKIIMYIRRYAIAHPDVYGELRIRYQQSTIKGKKHCRSEYKYVQKNKGRWQVTITSSARYDMDKPVRLGYYLSAMDASLAIDQWIRDNKKEMPLNHPNTICPYHVRAILTESLKVDDTKGLYYKPYLHKPWMVRIGHKYLGCYDTIEQAAKVRDDWLMAQV